MGEVGYFEDLQSCNVIVILCSVEREVYGIHESYGTAKARLRGWHGMVMKCGRHIRLGIG